MSLAIRETIKLSNSVPTDGNKYNHLDIILYSPVKSIYFGEYIAIQGKLPIIDLNSNSPCISQSRNGLGTWFLHQMKEWSISKTNNPF